MVVELQGDRTQFGNPREAGNERARRDASEGWWDEEEDDALLRGSVAPGAPGAREETQGAEGDTATACLREEPNFPLGSAEGAAGRGHCAEGERRGRPWAPVGRAPGRPGSTGCTRRTSLSPGSISASNRWPAPS